MSGCYLELTIRSTWMVASSQALPHFSWNPACRSLSPLQQELPEDSSGPLQLRGEFRWRDEFLSLTRSQARQGNTSSFARSNLGQCVLSPEIGSSPPLISESAAWHHSASSWLMGQARRLTRPAHFPRTWRRTARLSGQVLSKPTHLPLSDLRRARGETAPQREIPTHENQQAAAVLQRNASEIPHLGQERRTHWALGLTAALTPSPVRQRRDSWRSGRSLFLL